MPFLFGLAPDGVYHARLVALAAVRSYRTFSPLLITSCLFSVALSLTKSENLAAGRYPASCLNGARTFLPA